MLTIGDLSHLEKPNLRNLGVVFDECFILNVLRIVISSCTTSLNFKSMVSKHELDIMIHAFVSSSLDFCNSLFTCLNQKELNRLQLVQN